MIEARPPNAAAGSPPPITLPNVTRSPATPSTPYQPAEVTRNPVSTSSMISRAPADWHSAASRALNPGRGGTIPMFAGHASVITHAIEEPRDANTDDTASGAHRATGAHKVDVLAPVRIGQIGAGSAHHEPGHAADRAERAHRGVHPTGRDLARLGEQ